MQMDDAVRLLRYRESMGQADVMNRLWSIIRERERERDEKCRIFSSATGGHREIDNPYEDELLN